MLGVLSYIVTLNYYCTNSLWIRFKMFVFYFPKSKAIGE